jgi:hypothetical protein
MKPIVADAIKKYSSGIDLKGIFDNIKDFGNEFHKEKSNVDEDQKIIQKDIMIKEEPKKSECPLKEESKKMEYPVKDELKVPDCCIKEEKK